MLIIAKVRGLSAISAESRVQGSTRIQTCNREVVVLSVCIAAIACYHDLSITLDDQIRCIVLPSRSKADLDHSIPAEGIIQSPIGKITIDCKIVVAAIPH